jgi:hypothetical protein
MPALARLARLPFFFFFFLFLSFPSSHSPVHLRPRWRPRFHVRRASARRCRWPSVPCGPPPAVRRRGCDGLGRPISHSLDRSDGAVRSVVMQACRAGCAAERSTPAAVTRSYEPAWPILPQAGMQILGFGGGWARWSCMRRRLLGTVAVSAVSQAAVGWTTPSSPILDHE